MALVEQRLDEVYEWVNGGPNRQYKDSARARLHSVTETLRTADKLAEALKEVRKERRNRLSSGWQAIIGIAALLAAAAPYVLFFATR